jgi:hypothetical protein
MSRRAGKITRGDFKRKWAQSRGTPRPKSAVAFVPIKLCSRATCRVRFQSSQSDALYALLPSARWAEKQLPAPAFREHQVKKSGPGHTSEKSRNEGASEPCAGRWGSWTLRFRVGKLSRRCRRSSPFVQLRYLKRRPPSGRPSVPKGCGRVSSTDRACRAPLTTPALLWTESLSAGGQRSAERILAPTPFPSRRPAC